MYVVIGYMTPSKKFVKEFVRVKPKAYVFHDKHFHSIMQLICYFKDNFSTLDYWKFVKKCKDPIITSTDNIRWEELLKKQKEEEQEKLK